VPLGLELGDFGPARRDPRLRRSLGLADDQPLLIYVGRLDVEKKPHIVADAFRRLPEELGARLVLLGEGPIGDEVRALGDPRIVTPGFVRDRWQLARWLASSDIYVSAMAFETFGVSIVEAQASGLPVVGVAGGAMIDRVTDDIGRLGPVDDPQAMAENILAVWGADRAQMAQIAQERARQYSWQHSMDALFGRVYPAALARAAERRLVAPTRASGALAKA
jgi:alpha-1,6-mannosyltransferase